MNLEIYPRFRDLLPPLTDPEFEQLEKSVLEEGIREPIRVWENKIVDGHNRYELSENYGLEFDTEEMIFPDEDAVCEWMIINQLGRRNLEHNIKTLFIGQLHELQKKRVGNPNLNKNGSVANSDTVSELENSKPTAEKIAEDFNVSSRTVERAAKVAQAFDKADDETKDAFKKGEISQKKLVESSKPKKEQDKTDTIDRSKYNDHTNMFKHHAGRIMSAAKDLLTEIDRLEDYCFNANIDIRALNPTITSRENLKKIRHIEASASGLKNIEICPLCKTDGCARCGKIGYIDKQNAEYIRKDIEKGVAVNV